MRHDEAGMPDQGSPQRPGGTASSNGVAWAPAADVRRAARDARAASRAVAQYGRQVRARAIAARDEALQLRLGIGPGASRDSAGCQHQWGAWQLQATWRASGERPEERAWHRGCLICYTEEYVRRRGTAPPADDAPLDGWLFQP